MSHQSGITASKSLREKFAEMKDGHIRVVVVVIENEKLVYKEEHNAERTFNQDFDKMISPLVQNDHAAYYFIRLDTISELNGHNWLLITYIPDEAKTRERMLYASTVATVKREFGLTYITQEIRATSRDEMTIQSVHQHLHNQAAAAPPPRTMHEEEMFEIHQREANADISINTRHATLQGLKFPFDENVIEAIHLFKKHNVDYIQFDIDLEKELILLSHSEAHATLEHIRKYLPDQQGRYHMYRFKHEFNHKKFDSILFLYSVPGHRSQVKQRMVYASCKESVIDNIEKKFGIVFDKKLEISDSTDFTMEYLIEQLHSEPLDNTTTTSFAKPKAPSSRGPRRLVNSNDNSDE
ncbi:unnamed protein product [Rotaria sp. Silwood1]|nr:unnamed protein product [Rotaria sp. Silwood1]CAF0898969.1 unnamed protein product [Rotaria sp. Silwood1]CAF3372225.1 unnamed protein product [Rotaria sp. Silwood1]CAF4609935.1 unnamed protein product [Rotaria sp. Silwood1]